MNNRFWNPAFSHTRILPLLLVLLFALSLLVNTVYVIEEHGHECTGEHCKICYSVAHSIQLLKAEHAAGLIALGLNACIVLLTMLYRIPRQRQHRAASLVTLKVKLSD